MTIIASLELSRYGVRANCIGPGGATRMVAQAMKIEVKNPEDYTEFEAMNPGNSAPGVVWLASDEALHVTGQVFRLVGNNLALYRPWETQTSAPRDLEEQMAAYNAALVNSITDTHIQGIFFWAWSFPVFEPNQRPAARVLYHWYTSPLA